MAALTNDTEYIVPMRIKPWFYTTICNPDAREELL